jgi:hypothetical protein
MSVQEQGFIEAISVFNRLGVQTETAAHPISSKFISQLSSIQTIRWEIGFVDDTVGQVPRSSIIRGTGGGVY